MKKLPSRPIAEAFDPRVTSAVDATKELAVILDAVADDLAAAMTADRRECMNGAFEAIEGPAMPGGRRYGERLVVIVTANIAAGHGELLRG